jgi:hypothetical protein
MVTIEISRLEFTYVAILIGFTVGVLSSTVVIFGNSLLDDFISNRNWSQKKRQQFNLNTFNLSAALLFTFVLLLVGRIFWY